MNVIRDKLKNSKNRKSTTSNYLSIWRQFNRFVIKLDSKPPTWEERLILFVGQLVQDGMQSSTVRSYISAIKGTLTDDGYIWNENRALLSALTKACKVVNDRVTDSIAHSVWSP